jgi:cytochrome c biogenesis protein CcmG, thiol:disulfide interchange protein DsbE
VSVESSGQAQPKGGRIKGILLLLAGLAFGIILGVLIIQTGPDRTGTANRRLPPTVGSRAADFTLDQLGGDAVKLSDLKGKPVVMNFWATWCPPCKEEMPLLEKYAQQHAGQVTFLGVDYAEKEDVVQQFITQAGVTFPILLDRAGIVSDLYYVRNYPITFFIDSDGVVRAQHMGLLSEDLMDRYLKTIGIEP